MILGLPDTQEMINLSNASKLNFKSLCEPTNEIDPSKNDEYSLVQSKISGPAHLEFGETSTDASATVEEADSSSVQIRDDLAESLNGQDCDVPKTFTILRKQFNRGLLRKPLNTIDLVDENLPEPSRSDNSSTGKVHLKCIILKICVRAHPRVCVSNR